MPRKSPDHRPLAEKFWSKVEKSDGCWLWRGLSTRYGMINVGGGRTRGAHRVSYEMANGPIPKGMFVCHRCDNPLCVRPDHLFLGTPLDNMEDKTAKGRARYLRGEEQPVAVLTEDDVRAIRASYVPGKLGLRRLAQRYGVHRQTISNVINRVSWAHIP